MSVQNAQPEPAGHAETSSKAVQAATKDAEAATLDDLVRDTKAKAAGIAGMAPTEAIGKIAEAVTRDASVPESDRKTITDRLRATGE